MVLICVIAHDPLANSLNDIVEHVFGNIEKIHLYDILANEDPDLAIQNIYTELVHDTVKNILILTDIPGSTPANIAVNVSKRLKQAGIQSEVISGLNACMMLTAYSNRFLELDALVAKSLESSIKGIVKIS